MKQVVSTLIARAGRPLILVAVASLVAIPACQTSKGLPLISKCSLAPTATPTPKSLLITLEQMSCGPSGAGENGRTLIGKDHGFDSLSFIISDVYPGGGPPVLHIHDTEEAFIVLDGEGTYVVEEPTTHERKTITAKAPYVVRVPAGVYHAFINSGTTVMHQVSAFPTAEISARAISDNPLLKK